MCQPSSSVPAPASSSKGSAAGGPSTSVPAAETLATAILYKGVADLFRRVKQEPKADSLAFKKVNSQEYDKVEKARDERGEARCRFFYLAEHKLLIVTIPTAQHERLHGYLDDLVILRFGGMNLGHQWVRVGAQTYRSARRGAAGSGEGDSARQPISRMGHNRWPTLVIEAGYSQSLSGLRMKMRWWFLASNHEVKIVLLGKLYRGQGLIRVEKWRERPYRRAGATMTRGASAAGAADPYPDQRVEIRMAPGITETSPARLNPQSYVVTSDLPLRLEFDALMEYQPGPGQGDILLTAQDMQELGVRAWSEL